MPLHVRPPSEGFLTVRTLKRVLHLMHLPMLGSCQHGVKAFAALPANVAFAAHVGLPVFQELSGTHEALAADGADVRELTLLGVGLLVMHSQSTEVGEAAAAEWAGERDGHAVIFALVLRQVPRVLEGSLALRTMKGSLSSVGELVSPNV